MGCATPQDLGLLLAAYRMMGAGKTVPAVASYILCRGIEHMLAQGYRFVATLPDGRLIVERT
ncbi:MAG: hypothetical protein OXI27_00330 [Thaumarchaeota archaeon]|nr:hypothetical protein [Nitrososphaerota archaeon]